MHSNFPSTPDVHVPCDGCGGKCTGFGTTDYRVQRIAAMAERQGLRLEHREKSSPKAKRPVFAWDLAVAAGGPLAVKGATLEFIEQYLAQRVAA